MTVALVFAAGWLAAWLLMWRPLGLTRSVAAPTIPVAVVVPARNEATTISELLDAIAAQVNKAAAVVVVDDQSSDATATIATYHASRPSVVTGQALAAGWAGKPWAMHQGVQRANELCPDPLIVFLDADVSLSPEALGSIAAAHARHRGLVSVAPFHRTERFHESLSAVFNAVSIGATGIALPGRHGRTWAAFGPCVAISSADLERIGGIESIASSVVDDLDLARAAHDARLPVHGFTGGELVRFRMYPSGPGPLFEGWTKNIALGFGRTPKLLGFLGFLWITALLMPMAALATAGTTTAVVTEVLVAFQSTVLLRRIGRFRFSTPFLMPLLAVVFVAVFLRSAVLVLTRRPVRWRGRSVPTRR
ncbi:MAG: glycosyltransferase family 2 protein [Acidimicrobiia bacterium]